MREGPTTRAVGWLMITGYGVIVDEEARMASEQARTAVQREPPEAADDPDVAVTPGKDLY